MFKGALPGFRDFYPQELAERAFIMNAWRDVARRYAFVEYDGSFRWRDRPNGTLQLLTWMTEDGLVDQVLLGMDAARQGYLAVYGGSPGLTWLLDGFSVAMEGAGLDASVRERLFVANPTRAFAFASDGGDG